MKPSPVRQRASKRSGLIELCPVGLPAMLVQMPASGERSDENRVWDPMQDVGIERYWDPVQHGCLRRSALPY